MELGVDRKDGLHVVRQGARKPVGIDQLTRVEVRGNVTTGDKD